jgi:hypothetical protein
MSYQVLAHWDSFIVYSADGGHSVVGQEGPGQTDPRQEGGDGQ